MKATYVDIHIHTSDNPNKLSSNYNVKKLVDNVKKIAKDNPILLSLTDHNTINKNAYMELLKEDTISIILGVELHIKKYSDAPPYHCHIIFNTEITERNIDDINNKLNKLYPDKVVKDDDENTPNIENIINTFDMYEFLLLPHGGQSHRTFDKATSKTKIFDTSMEQSIYHNHFDGFTSRSSKGLKETKVYFKKLGIDDFVNLVTCTDNYNPLIYPKTKENDAEEFIPTWILAEPTFEGLRLSLSEESRLHYDYLPPQGWTKTFGNINLKNDKIEIDVNMTPGLNVVIGGSSSGKTLFVDSLVKGSSKDFTQSKYNLFSVKDINIENPTNVQPYYISQNFIMEIINDSKNDLGAIPIISQVFPEDSETLSCIRDSLITLRCQINALVDSAKRIEELKIELSHIKPPNYLFINKVIKEAPIEKITPNEENKRCLSVSKATIDKYKRVLYDMKSLFNKHPIVQNRNKEIELLASTLEDIVLISDINGIVFDRIEEALIKLKTKNSESDRYISQIKIERGNLLKYIYEYIKLLQNFYNAKDKLSKFNVSFKTKEIKVAGHTLSIKNSFNLTEERLVEAINTYLIKEKRLSNFYELEPSNIVIENFSKRPRINSYDEFSERVYGFIAETNKKEYEIITKDGHDYKSLSPGWKSAIILDLILGYKDNTAPIIIDQPEDNLATSYINHDLIEMIKRIKVEKQVILVSHNATIPMLGDAQNLIMCENEGEKLYITSASLESKIKGKKTLDWIAELTDGGKSSIKKRVKKYNFRSYKGDVDL